MKSIFRPVGKLWEFGLCMSLKKNYLILIVFLGGFGLGPRALAQRDVGTILGTVSDRSGAALVGAIVNITNQSSNSVETETTDKKGFYTSHPLPPGRYSVTISNPGFQSSTTRDIVLDVAANVTVDASLPIGSTSTNVTVEASSPALNLSDAQIGNTIDTRAAQQLPLNGRNVLALATTTPGVVSGVGATSQGFANRGTSVTSIRISGGVEGVNNILLDGILNIEPWGGEIGINAKSDAIQEFKIMSGVIPAQYGYTSGGVINMITRSGQDRFHGGLYEFFRNDFLDAVIAFPKPTFGKPETRFNNYGGTLGGPIFRNRLFFFTNYEEYRYVNETPSYATVPTPREYNGDFSDLGKLANGVCVPVLIYDPSTATTSGSRIPFAGNVIPASRIDAVAKAYQEIFYPVPNNTTGSYNSCTHANNYIQTPKVVSNERLALGRLDFRANNDSFYVRYMQYLNTQNNGAGYSPLYYRFDNDLVQHGVFSETHILSPTLVNNAEVGFLRSYFAFDSATAGQNILQKIGLPLPNIYPTVGPIMTTGLSTPNVSNGGRANTLVEFNDDVIKTLGSHTVQFGASARFNEGYNNQMIAGNDVNFTFGAAQTAQGNNTTIVSGTGSQYASFLLGAVASGSNGAVAGVAYRKWQYAGYVEDNWRVNSKLTINAGLRYDFQAQAHEKNNKFGNVDLTQPNPSNPLLLGKVEYAGQDGVGSNFSAENYNDWGPRLGFAWVLTNDNKTSLRGGYALYYAPTSDTNYDQSVGSSNGFSGSVTSFPSATVNGVAFQLSSGFPGPTSDVQGVAGGQTAFLGQAVYTFRRIQKDPTSQQYTLTLSREFPFKTVVDVTYLNNSGRHYTLANQNLNTLSPNYFSLGTAYLNASVANPYAGMVPGTLGAASITRANLLKPYPYYTAAYNSFPRIGSFNSNYMYLSVQRRVENGLQIIGSYTLGRLEDDPIANAISSAPGGGISTSNGPQNPRDLKADYSVDTFDVTHRLAVSALYQLPFGEGKRYLSSGLTSRIIGGLQLNMIMTLESGRPLLITGASNQGIATRPNFNPGVSVRVAQQSKSEWFNPQAFINPPDYSFGNVPRTYTDVRGPGQQNFDISVFKTTTIHDNIHLELRLEAFNALNKTNLQNPNTTFTAGSPANPSNPTAQGGTNTNSNFGVVTASSPARIVQLGAKLSF